MTSTNDTPDAPTSDAPEPEVEPATEAATEAAAEPAAEPAAGVEPEAEAPAKPAAGTEAETEAEAETADVPECAKCAVASEAASEAEPTTEPTTEANLEPATEPATDAPSTPARPKGLIIGIAAVALVVVIVLIAIVGSATGLFTGESAQENNASEQQADADGSASVDANAVAAVINGQSISELEVTEYITSVRSDMGLDADDDWGKWLVLNGYTPETVRQEVIDGFIYEDLYSIAADELGVQVEQADIDEALAEAKASYESDEEFQQDLEYNGFTEETYIEQWLTPMLLEEKIVEAAVGDALEEDENAFMNWLESYKQQKGVQVYDMPEGLPYDIDLAPYQEMLENGELDEYMNYSDGSADYADDAADYADEEMYVEDEDGNQVPIDELMVEEEE